MDEEKKATTYESFRDTVEDYGEHGGHDFLTDPDAVAAAAVRAEHDSSIGHGEALRSAREQRGFTLKELSEKTGIAEGTLGDLEAGEAVLPLGQLIRLSKALSMKMADFISTGQEAFSIVRADKRQSFSRFGKAKEAKRGYEYESLAPNKKDRAVEPFIVTLHPADEDELSSHDGQEFIYVLEGQMEVVIGATREILGPGDAVYYDSTDTHLVRAHGDKPARILAVLVS